ncbi:cytochrome o ubiquinol oxidase subunit III [Paracoccus aerodenitrificans]|uniref:cytochrome o ubiquinol oxidase subunit III n=1 Tax=Paracoccus aerodenitrificans TaxID=3017781 RepID=UPI0022F0E944|nr:cytochrome o ubiquinol oxidase subunit III [Paracoccus aerodenitrificans]WBU63995.1 cytochrome o ubiquinol oxidase subunit III [Paracoccus aerodenitrificans]
MSSEIVTDPGDERVYHPAEEPHHPEGHSTPLGFWVYLMSDCLIFAILFATFAVLGDRFGGGPGPKDLFDLPLVALNTAMLLISSITFGFAMLAMHDGNQKGVLKWLGITACFGAAFLAIELYEFSHLIGEGAGPGRSAFLSAFFTLVGTHGLHVTVGLIWLTVMVIQIRQRGLSTANQRRLNCLSLFWHFLDVIWIGVFSFVYLMGMI